MTTATAAAGTQADLSLRHTVATRAYRAAKVLRDAPPDFRAFLAGKGSRSAGEILAHLSDLLDWALSLARGRSRRRNSKPHAWSADSERFFTALAALDGYLASGAKLHATHGRRSAPGGFRVRLRDGSDKKAW